jgi:eukaryotic-like serine/threonine-protein kinase
METPILADSFVAMLKKSGLLPADEIDAAVARFGLGDEPVARELARAFLREGLLTRFQAERVLEGRYRGFFIDHYKVLEILGAGGMACLYLAEDIDSGERVALKVLADIFKDDAAMLTRLKIEARAGGQLNHPGIIRTFGVHQTDDVYGDVWYLVMEYVEGINLEELINLKGPMPVAQASDFVRQAAAGLQHAHTAGLVHRDVKPGNLLVDAQGAIKILDFGLALLHGEEAAADEFSLSMIFGHGCLGTADYIAPEQSLDSSAVDSRADIYGLGCTLYVALSGRLPYPMASSCQKLNGHRSQAPPPLREIAPGVPAELVTIVEKMMAKAPADRYQSMTAVVEALVPFSSRNGVEFDYPKVLAWRAKDARRRFAAQKRTGDSSPSTGSSARSPQPSKFSLHSASTKRLPQASADTSIASLSKGERSAISLVAPFEGTERADAMSQAEPPLSAARQGPVLVSLAGGPALALAGKPIVIGRDPECDVCIASTQVSGRHCELRPEGFIWRVVDLESKNGTQVNGLPITNQFVRNGDRLTIARQHHFRIEYPAGHPPHPERLNSWQLYGIVAAALALTAYCLWRLLG